MRPEPPPPLDGVILPRTRDLGDGFTVRRALPSGERRLVGPFIFFDQMGPVLMRGGQGLDVRPHPHIGLATVTYLFEGEIIHRDSLGSVQAISPGAVNWMTAGRGIVHSERTGPEVRARGGALFGIQAWVALPKKHEETAPTFVHHPDHSLPLLTSDGVRARVIAGSFSGARSPARTFSELFYVDAQLEAGARLELPAVHEERAVYLLTGALSIGGTRHSAGQLLLLRPGPDVLLEADVPCRVMLLGGEPMDGPRHIWWNFVSSSEERLEQAKADWAQGRFPAVPGDPERIPLPETTQPAPVHYP